MRFLSVAIVACLTSTLVTAQNADAPVRAGTAGVTHPRIVQISSPFYPPIAQTARVQGNVIIDAIIDVTGRVAATTVTRSIPLLDGAAVNAVRTWEFEPPRLNGRPVRFVTTITLRFELFDGLVPLPLGEPKPSASGMPWDFTVVYEPSCPTVAILTTARHDLEAVYRALATAGLLVRAEGLRVWVDPRHSTAKVSDSGVEMAIAGEAARVDCSGAPSSPVYRLRVRGNGTWRQLWPPWTPSLLPPDYATQLGPALALLKRMVDGQ